MVFKYLFKESHRRPISAKQPQNSGSVHLQRDQGCGLSQPKRPHQGSNLSDRGDTCESCGKVSCIMIKLIEN